MRRDRTKGASKSVGLQEDIQGRVAKKGVEGCTREETNKREMGKRNLKSIHVDCDLNSL